ncbi:nitroreductase family protein [Microbacterium sp. ZW T5_56]|uniref:nitroreductase family protein n=1 Tax=Microbacterium sp. ZW T5_56 TaxID=3378081 RepID=UPI0038545ACD
MSAYDAALRRRSASKVTDAAPDRAELVRLIEAAGRVADHSNLQPWRLIELRGEDRVRLGRAIHKADGHDGVSTKPLRAPLLIAVVFSEKPSGKVPAWEQEAVASGVAHLLSLLLDEADWGVIWRTGGYTRSKAVAKAHGLRTGEQLLGWLYVGGKPDERIRTRRPIDAASFVTSMPAGSGSAIANATKSAKPAKKCKKKKSKKK